MPRVPSDIFEVVRREEIVSPKSRLELKLVTGLSEVFIASEPGIAYAVARGVPSSSPAAPRDTTLDISFDCNGYDIDGNPGQGVGIATATAYGSIPFIDYTATAVALATAYGDAVWSGVYDGLAIAYAYAYGDLLLEGLGRNWVKWSNIGSADFTIWKDNVAGARVLDWKGWVYGVKKLGNKVVVYGQNGVSVLFPSGNTWGLQTVHNIGLKSKLAYSGNNATHYFVDSKGKLYMLGENPAKSSLFETAIYPHELGYSEFILSMESLVLSWDEKEHLLYICDGTNGYVYNPSNQSLGKGPNSITGIGVQDETVYILSSVAEIEIPVFEIWTDIYDMGTRNAKHITSLEYGVDLSGKLEVAIRYRLNKSAEFKQTKWFKVDDRGMVFIATYGSEFQFGTKVSIYEQFELDYIKVNGFGYIH